MKQLLAFGGLSHDPQSILAAVYQFALVGLVLGCDIGSRIVLARLELALQRSHTPITGGGDSLTIRKRLFAMTQV
jgi:hypothetical protein